MPAAGVVWNMDDGPLVLRIEAANVQQMECIP